MIDIPGLTEEEIVIAALTEDVDDAVRPLQDALGITDGGLCDKHLNEENWRLSTHQGRINRLIVWLRDEQRGDA